MAEEKMELQDINYRRVFAWTELFRGFGVAIDPRKLALAAAGIVVMWFGWWLLSWIFYSTRSVPVWEPGPSKDLAAFREFQQDRYKWNLLYEAAGSKPVRPDANDLAETPDEWVALNKAIADNPDAPQVTVNGKTYERPYKPYGGLSLWPGAEDRGPNPCLLVTGQIVHTTPAGRASVPWSTGFFWNWLVTKEGPVVIEPLIKLLRPIIYLLHPAAGFWNRVYFLLAVVWTAFVWAVFGGALSRMAAVQIARRDKIGPLEALRFTWARIVSYFTAPLLPLLFVGVLVVLLVLFGLIQWIPYLGDLWSGLLWGLVILAGLAMAAVLVGLVAWPLMIATISTEGSDNFDALSRAYSYLYQYPWHYLWYSLVGIAYGAVLIFFVGFMGSALVYLGKWGVQQWPPLEGGRRDPTHLCLLAPESFGWRALLLQGAVAPDGRPVVVNGQIEPTAYAAYADDNYLGWTWLGSFLVAIWTHVLFLLVLGFGYSFFWTAGTIIYLLMRRKADDTEFDEVYLEEEEPEETYSMTTPPAPAPATSPGAPAMQMVEAPTLRSSAPPPSPGPTPAPSHEPAGTVAGHEPAPASSGTPPEPAPPTSDGNRAPEGGTAQG